MKSILNEKSSSNVKTDSYNHSYKKKSGGQHSGQSHNKPQEAKQPHKRIRETDMFKPTDNFNVMDVVSGMNKKKEEEERKRKRQQEFSDLRAREQQKALLEKKKADSATNSALEEDLKRLLFMRVQTKDGRIFKAFTTWNDGILAYYKCWVCPIQVKASTFCTSNSCQLKIQNCRRSREPRNSLSTSRPTSTRCNSRSIKTSPSTSRSRNQSPKGKTRASFPRRQVQRRKGACSKRPTRSRG